MLRAAGKALTRFLCVYAPVNGLLEHHRVGDSVHGAANAAWARSTAWCLNSIGMDASPEGSLIHGALATMTVEDECNAFGAYALIAAAVAALPLSAPRALRLAVAAAAVTAAVNQVRLMALTWIANYAPEHFGFFEGVVLRTATWLLLLLLLAAAARSATGPATWSSAPPTV